MAKPLPLPVVTEVDSMYASEPKIHPREIDGRFQRLRIAAVFLLLGLFYLVPWFLWDGRQAVLFDLPARKFYILGLTFFPQDFFLLSWLLIMAALALFFFTALAGRLWCGYACPQTVWTEVFLWMERLCEGPRQRRLKLDQAPWNRDKILRRGSKHLLWLIFALWTGLTFVGFFTPIRDLAGAAYPFAWSGWESFWVGFYALATWGNAGFLREQVCKYMCPYARFQSAMFDRNSLIISYDTSRGEPRGSRKRGSDYRAAGLGDCIDCTVCVQVCPTGIDIREGLQYECIACAACIDACDSVMDKVGYPRGLIRYTTDNALNGQPSRILRPRILVYGALLLGLAFAFVAVVTTQVPLIAELLRDRNALYRETAQGGVENAYTLRLVNKENQDRSYRIRLSQAPEGLALVGNPTISIAAGSVGDIPITLAAEAGRISGMQEIRLEIVAEGNDRARREIANRFFAP